MGYIYAVPKEDEIIVKVDGEKVYIEEPIVTNLKPIDILIKSGRYKIQLVYDQSLYESRKSIVINLEKRNDQIWGIIEIDELTIFYDYVRGFVYEENDILMMKIILRSDATRFTAIISGQYEYVDALGKIEIF